MTSNKASDRSLFLPSKGSVCQRGVAKQFGLRETMAARICKTLASVTRDSDVSELQLNSICASWVVFCRGPLTSRNLMTPSVWFRQFMPRAAGFGVVEPWNICTCQCWPWDRRRPRLRYLVSCHQLASRQGLVGLHPDRIP